MSEFCYYLRDKVEHSTCATCNTNNHIVVENLTGTLPSRTNWYLIEETLEGYNVEVKAYVIYGRNTRMGSKQVIFTLDKNGKVINKIFPEQTCM